MRYILMTYVSPDHVAEWDRMTPEERQLDVDRTIAWFREHAAYIVGGEELGYPRLARTVRRGGITDGPFIETKELLGGFIVLDVPDEANALEIAGAWPGLEWPDDAVEVRPVGDSQAEVNA
jgi:hypothetical protein